MSTPPKAQGEPLPPWVVIAGLAATVIIIATILLTNLFDDDPQAAPAPDTPTTSPSPTGSEGDAPATSRHVLDHAPPSSTLSSADGCSEPDPDDVDDLVASLGDDGATVELSAAWSGAGQPDSIALMVRSSEGTMDQPNLVWVKVDDEWQSASRLTVDASDKTAASVDVMAGHSARVVVQCMTAGSR